MRKIINRLICKLRGHKRGKRVGLATDIVSGLRNYYCPRCHARWCRKAKA